MFTIAWLLYGTIVFYSLADALQTKMLLDLGATELNPILDWLIRETGTVYSIFIVKGFWLGFLLILLILKTKEENHKNEKTI